MKQNSNFSREFILKMTWQEALVQASCLSNVSLMWTQKSWKVLYLFKFIYMKYSIILHTIKCRYSEWRKWDTKVTYLICLSSNNIALYQKSSAYFQCIPQLFNALPDQYLINILFYMCRYLWVDLCTGRSYWCI